MCGILSCYSCGIFFKDVVKKKINFQCSFENHCPIMIKTRSQCSKCRLDKCIFVGMNSEGIQYDFFLPNRNIYNVL